MTITGSDTPNFAFPKLGSQDNAGFSTINELIVGIDTKLDANKRLIASGQTPSTGYTIRWNGSSWVSGQLETDGITDLNVTTGKIADSAVTSAKIADGTIVNADVNSAAAIAYSKLNLALGIVNADVSVSAAIAYSKLNLATSIVNADISASAAIVDTKLATISTALKVSNSATTATSANTASAIVARDASGNFTAGTITAALTGNASTATSATNLAGGAGGSIPYQSAVSTTAMLANGTSGEILTSNGTTLAPSWQTISSGSVTLAGDVAGAANSNSLGNNVVTNAKLRQGAATTVIGRSANSTGNVADIAASANGQVLKRSSDALSFASIVNADIDAAAAIAYSKLNISNSIVAGDITGDAVETAKIKDANVTYAKLGNTAKVYSPVTISSNTTLTIGTHDTTTSASIPLVQVTAAATINIPTGGVTGSVINIFSSTSGTVTVQPVSSSVTINGSTSATYTINAQYSVVSLICYAANTWIITGDYV